MQKLIIIVITLALNACLVGPNYVRPIAVIPSKFKEAKGKSFITPNPHEWKIAQPQDRSNRGAWWKIFHDPQLDALEIELNRFNQTIVNALANYNQARAIVDEARASFFPTLAGSFNILRQKTGGGATTFTSSSDGITSTGTATTGVVQSGVSKTITTYSGILDANWEPDIWGLVRRTVEADASAAEASDALLAVTRLSAQGSLAQYYFELRTLDSDQQLLNKTVNNYKKALQLTRNQYRAGVAAQSDILQALSLLQSTKALAINNGILRSQYEHAIAVLIGRPPADFTLSFQPLKAHPPIIPVTIPSAWLERRPDVAQAERLMQQMNAQIGITIAAYFPTLSLSSSASAAGINFSKLIHTPSIGWSYGLQLAETFFDGGLRDATVRAAKAAYIAQVASYRQTVLTALQDVEDNLVNLRLLKEQGFELTLAAKTANDALKIVINQYKAGTVPYSSVLTAEINAFSAQKSANDVMGLQMSAAAGLVKALGGGWNVADLQPI